MSVVAADHIFVCALLVVQGGVWTSLHYCRCTTMVVTLLYYLNPAQGLQSEDPCRV